jgi:hypothetical protein
MATVRNFLEGSTMPSVRLLLLLLVPLAACRGDVDRGDRDVAHTGMDRPGMEGMMSMGMMDTMAAHMRMMDTASGATIEAMIPMHRQMAADMLTRMRDERRNMNMPAEPHWDALADSARRDLERMAGMSAAERTAMMAAHRDRMTRLMQMHRDMMQAHQ